MTKKQLWHYVALSKKMEKMPKTQKHKKKQHKTTLIKLLKKHDILNFVVIWSYLYNVEWNTAMKKHKFQLYYIILLLYDCRCNVSSVTHHKSGYVIGYVTNWTEHGLSFRQSSDHTHQPAPEICRDRLQAGVKWQQLTHLISNQTMQKGSGFLDDSMIQSERLSHLRLTVQVNG